MSEKKKNGALAMRVKKEKQISEADTVNELRYYGTAI